MFAGEHRALEHKVRGGSALTAALHKASLGAESGSGSDAHEFPGQAGFGSSLSGSFSTHDLPSTPRSAVGRTQSGKRSKLSFLSCFGAGSFEAELDDEPCVSGAEVGIRPCFYWLNADVSEEERSFAEANARWLKSDCQDDVLVVEGFGGVPAHMFVGVFDGHGPYGRNAAKHASASIPAVLASKGSLLGLSDRRWAKLLRETCQAVNLSMHDPAQSGFDASLSGTTACFAVICGRKVHIASAGDSRCFVARRTAAGGVEAVQLTEDAKPHHPEERRRIHAYGGVVKQLRDEEGQHVGAYRVFRRGDDVLPGLAMSRSLGDIYAQSVGVTCEPLVTTYTLTDRDLFLIFATDGVCDVMTNEEVVSFVDGYKARREAAPLSCAEALTLEAQNRWKALHTEAIIDDISVAIVHTCVSPPLRRQASLPGTLTHAALCNDEANEMYEGWKALHDRSTRPSRSRSGSHDRSLHGGGDGETDYFRHVFSPEPEPEEAVRLPPAGKLPPGQQQQAQQLPDTPLAAAAAPEAPTPDCLDALAVAFSGSLGTSAPEQQLQQQPAAVPPPAAAAASLPAGQPLSMQLPAAGAAFPGGGHALMEPSPFSSPDTTIRLGSPRGQASGSLSAAAAAAAAAAPTDDSVDESSIHRSLRSSLTLSEPSDPSSQRGEAYAAAVGSSAVHPAAVPGGPRTASMPIAAAQALPPIRKAYPSSSGMSHKSETGCFLAAETLLSADSHWAMSRASAGTSDGKVRGGIPRSTSAPGLSFLQPLSRSLAEQRVHSSNESLSHGGSFMEGSVDDARMPTAGTPSTPTEGLLSCAVTPPDRSPALPSRLLSASSKLLRSRSEGAAMLLAASSNSQLLDSPGRALAPVAEAAPLADGTPPGTGPLAVPLRSQRSLPPRSPQAKVFVLRGVHSGSSDSLASGLQDSPHARSALLAEHVAAVHLSSS